MQFGVNITTVWEVESLERKGHRSHQASFSEAAPYLGFSKGSIGSGTSQVPLLQARAQSGGHPQLSPEHASGSTLSAWAPCPPAPGDRGMITHASTSPR